MIVTLRADDVIHSFWVPSLTGKKDLIPGRESTIAFRADIAGIYRGQCAEFCGYQHAHMALFVIADEPADFERWVVDQRAPAKPPTTEQERHGLALVETSSVRCVTRSTARARKAGARPISPMWAAARRSAPGRFPNTSSQRVAWIADPQQYKPGVNMPPVNFEPRDLVAISAYLGSLQ